MQSSAPVAMRSSEFRRSSPLGVMLPLLLPATIATNPYLCNVNEYYNASTPQEPCVKCPRGTSNFTACQSTDSCPRSRCAPTCGYNQYYAEPGGPVNQWNPLGGCTNCPQGRLRNSKCNTSASCALETCEACPRGKFTDAGGQSCQGDCKCKPCLAGRYWVSPSNATQAGAVDDDYWPYPFGNGYMACPICPAGKFSSKAGSLACEACPAGSISDKGQTSCNMPSTTRGPPSTGTTPGPGSPPTTHSPPSTTRSSPSTTTTTMHIMPSTTTLLVPGSSSTMPHRSPSDGSGSSSGIVPGPRPGHLSPPMTTTAPIADFQEGSKVALGVGFGVGVPAAMISLYILGRAQRRSTTQRFVPLQHSLLNAPDTEIGSHYSQL